MKKNLFILAVTAAALASCSNDVTTAVNKTLNVPQEITFRSTTDGMTRAADITTSNLSTIYVTANKSGSSVTNEFGGTTPETFTKAGSIFSSSTKHYWPAAGSLDFIAFAPATGSDITRTDSTSFSEKAIIITCSYGYYFNSLCTEGTGALLFRNGNDEDRC